MDGALGSTPTSGLEPTGLTHPARKAALTPSGPTTRPQARPCSSRDAHLPLAFSRNKVRRPQASSFHRREYVVSASEIHSCRHS